MLSPSIVGDIAHGDLSMDGLTPPDVAALVRHELAHPACAAIAGDGVPPGGIPDILRAADHGQAMRSIAVSATATRVSALLADAGVRSLALKGPALAAQTTGSWLGRGSADVDVLIHVRDTSAADRALQAAGCWSRAGYTDPPTQWERYHRGERVYLGLPVTVDLHWRVDSAPGYFSAPFDALWQRRKPIATDGLDVLTLDRVDALLVTAEHGAKERWARWFWALDAVRQVEQLDPALWPEVALRARASGCARAVDQCLGVALACGARMADGIGPSGAIAEAARSLLVAAAAAGPVEWTRRAAISRRRQRWLLADRPTAAAGGLARSMARLMADRRAPGAPQVRATTPVPQSASEPRTHG